jgi:hypothetical protein
MNECSEIGLKNPKIKFSFFSLLANTFLLFSSMRYFYAADIWSSSTMQFICKQYLVKSVNLFLQRKIYQKYNIDKVLSPDLELSFETI